MDHIEKIKKDCWDMSGSYTDIAKIGQGYYGRVYRAKNEHHQRIAIKQLLHLDNENVCVSARREIEILDSLNHENVMGLSDVCLWGNGDETPKLSLVLEYCAHDLHELIKGGQEDRFTFAEKKNIIGEILCGVQYIHSMNILHRDLKPANILITEYGEVKIADFGFACWIGSTMQYEPQEYMTPDRFTLGFRPPEVLLGAQNYGKEADMWSVAFLFIELVFRGSFSQSTNQKQLQSIVNLCGPIGTDIWPGVDRLPGYQQAIKTLNNNINTPLLSAPGFKESFPDIHAFSFFRELIHMNPRMRMSASEALQHDLFRHNPKPAFIDQSKLSSTFV